MLDGVLREEQAGFRKGLGCSDQIFVVRHLMQHANEMKASLSLCFVDFEKAFDSVSREAMGKVLRYYGVPEWLVKLVKDLHEGTFCKVKSDGPCRPTNNKLEQGAATLFQLFQPETQTS